MSRRVPRHRLRLCHLPTVRSTEQYKALSARSQEVYAASLATFSSIDREKLAAHGMAAQALLLERSATAYEAGKTLLRASHIVNQ